MLAHLAVFAFLSESSCNAKFGSHFDQGIVERVHTKVKPTHASEAAGVLLALQPTLACSCRKAAGATAALCRNSWPVFSEVDDDEFFMHAAICEAKRAMSENEVPIGAVVVQNGKIISTGYNRVEQLKDASAHAEMMCLRAASAASPTWRLNAVSHTTLYCTLEPCPMCLAALHAFRVDRLVYGAANDRMGAVESAMRPAAPVQHPFHTLEITGGVLAPEAGDLMRVFFRKRRRQPSYKDESKSEVLHRKRNHLRLLLSIFSSLYWKTRNSLSNVWSHLRRRNNVTMVQ